MHTNKQESTWLSEQLSAISRRRFFGSAGAVAVAAFLAPRSLHRGHADDGIVNQMRKGAVKAAIKTQKVRDNISVLIGSGGNNPDTFVKLVFAGV